MAVNIACHCIITIIHILGGKMPWALKIITNPSSELQVVIPGEPIHRSPVTTIDPAGFL